MNRDAPAWVELVGQCDEPVLPESVRMGVLCTAEASVPHLIGLLTDDERYDEYGPIHAAHLLAEIRAPSAIEPLVRILVEDPGSPLADAADEALLQYGADAVPALLDALFAGADHVGYALGACAGRGGAADPRVARARDALLPLLHDDPGFAADCLALVGDASVVPRLLEVLATLKVSETEGLVAGQAVLELIRAIERLGGDPGDLGARRKQEVERVRAPMAELLAQLPR